MFPSYFFVLMVNNNYEDKVNAVYLNLHGINISLTFSGGFVLSAL